MFALKLGKGATGCKHHVQFVPASGGATRGFDQHWKVLIR